VFRLRPGTDIKHRDQDSQTPIPNEVKLLEKFRAYFVPDSSLI